tara:strand:+ start:416 stop:1330 length:915 start_codon:yes stop_codon:yes gene_type:complete
MSFKQIKINPEFFKVKTNKSCGKKMPNPKIPNINSVDVKSKLIDKIKKHQTQQSTLDNKLVISNDDFDAQLNNLEKIIQKGNEVKNKKETKKRRRREKKEAKRLMQQQVNVQPSQVIPARTMQSGEPVYGCLKGGRKPTLRQYNNTLKSTNIDSVSTHKIKFIDPQSFPKKVYNVDEMKVRQDNLSLLKTRMATPKKQFIPPKLIQCKRTLKKFKLGKNKKNLTVGVLIKSGQTRKLVKDETQVLKNRCLTEVKQYLRKHNLIRAGTNAPENVLRKIYEDSFLAGKIFNKNPATLLHNYMNEDD